MERAIETYRDGAFWCSGTLNMLGYNQNPTVIFNPYSYSELQSLLTGLDAYLDCVSGPDGRDAAATASSQSCESIKPTVAILEQQGVSSIAVLTRCDSLSLSPIG